MSLAARMRLNAALLDMLVHRPGGALSKRDVAGLADDLRRQASEIEELTVMTAGTSA